MSLIRSSDFASTRVSPADALGVCTVEPEALGRFHRAWSSAWLTAATSAPVFASSDGRDALLLAQQRDGEVHRVDLGVALVDGEGAGGVDHLDAARGELGCVHVSLL